MSPQSKTVSIVDDDQSVRTGLSRLLRSTGYEVSCYSSANEFLNKVHDTPSHCLLLDVRMEGLSGLELQSRLQSEEIHIPIIFLTGHGDIPMSVQAIKHGAIDFLTKPVDETCLIKAIESAIFAGNKQRLVDANRRSIEQKLDLLTCREHEVLRCLLSGALNKQVAGHLQIVEKTVKVHRARILEKTDTHSMPELVRLSVEAGIEPIDCRPK